MTVLFLYTELADYFLKCCEELSCDCQVHIVRWPVNKEAPFEFKIHPNLHIYDKPQYTYPQLLQLVQEIKPDLITCSGWVDKDYLKIVKQHFGKIPTVLTFDTHWRGDLKQQIAKRLSPFTLLRRFSHAWVPGLIQKTYALQLGFKAEHIYTGFYCCNLPAFNNMFLNQRPLKKLALPKVFLYVGRYYDFKGITDLWEAFISLQKETPNEWELWCLGQGSIAPVSHPKIKHFGFVQPHDLEPILQKAGVFVLPSRFEPWAVVVQEYAAAGFPLLLSKEVGAAETFLEEGKNGFSFASGNPEDLKKQLKKIINSDPNDLLLMSETSHCLAQTITQQNWTATVKAIHHGFK